MNDSCLVKIKNTSFIIKTLLKEHIYFKDLKTTEDYIYFKVSTKEIEHLNTLFNIEIIKYYGLSKIKYFIKEHYILILSFIFSYIVLTILSNVIFDIEVITNNTKIKENILYCLKENNIEKYKFIKSSKELDKVKNIILKNNKDTIEWIEITRTGTKYIVNVTPRVINKNEEDNKIYDVVSSKDALIKNIIITNGTQVKEVNELVKKGETIISSDITKFDKVVGKVSARGKVYAEVWYTVNISVPYNHIVYESTNETINHIYLDILGYKLTIMGHYKTNNSLNETTTLIDKPYLFFKVMKESKELYKYKKVHLTNEEAYNEALKRSDRIINDLLDTEEHIIERKVLKNNTYSSKIELELFYRVYENITEYKEVTLESE